MKRIALAGLAVLLAACGETAVEPSQTAARFHESGVDHHGAGGDQGAVWQRFTFPINEVRPIDCLGESLQLQGEVETRVRTVVNANGDQKILISQTAPTLVQTGLASGTVWSNANGSEIWTYHIEATGQLRSFHHTGVLRFHAESPTAPDLFLKHFIHVLIAEDGTVKVERATPDILECKYNAQS